MRFKKLLVIPIILMLVGCPPPKYPLLFGIDGRWRKNVALENESTHVYVTGSLSSYSWSDELFIQLKIVDHNAYFNIEQDTMKSAFKSKRAHFLDDKIIFSSSNFIINYTNSYKNKDEINIIIDTHFDHKPYQEMTQGDFISYLDMTAAEINITDILYQPVLIKIKYDKVLMENKLKKWVKNKINSE